MKDTERSTRLLRLEEVLERVPLKKPTIYRAIRLGKFPRPCKLLGARGSAWSEVEVNNWIAARLATRDVVKKVPQ